MSQSDRWRKMVERGRRRPVTVDTDEYDVTVDDMTDDSSAVVDEYNAQPDSGGVIGGSRGEQEYGIDSHVSYETTREADPLRAEENTATERDSIIDLGGVSAWSLEQSKGEEEEDAAQSERRELLGKNRERKDGDLASDIEARLASHPSLDAREVEVTVDRGRVSLNGSVPSERAKLLAEEIAESLPGVSSVDNRISVRD